MNFPSSNSSLCVSKCPLPLLGSTLPHPSPVHFYYLHQRNFNLHIVQHLAFIRLIFLDVSTPAHMPLSIFKPCALYHTTSVLSLTSLLPDLWCLDCFQVVFLLGQHCSLSPLRAEKPGLQKGDQINCLILFVKGEPWQLN